MLPCLLREVYVAEARRELSERYNQNGFKKAVEERKSADQRDVFRKCAKFNRRQDKLKGDFSINMKIEFLPQIRIFEKPEWVTWEQIREVIWSAHETNRVNGILVTTSELSAEKIEERISDKGKCVVALDGDKVVGTVSMAVCDMNAWFYKGKAAYIILLGVLPEYRQYGVAPRMLEVLDTFIEAAGCDISYAHTQAPNNATQSMMLNNGYRYMRYYHWPRYRHNTVELAKWRKGGGPSRLKSYFHFLIVRYLTKRKNPQQDEQLKDAPAMMQYLKFWKRISLWWHGCGFWRKADSMKIKKKIRKVFSENLPQTEVSADGTVDASTMDSLNIVTLMAALSKTFGIKMTYSDMQPEKLGSLDSIADMVLQRMKGEKNDHIVIQSDQNPNSNREPILDIPWSETEKTVVQRVLECAEREPDTIAIIVKDVVYSYAELASDIRKFHNGFVQMGVQAGDAVVLHAVCQECYLASLFALHLCGAVVVPVEKNVGQERVVEIATETNARLIVSNAELKNKCGAELSKWVDFAQVETAASADAHGSSLTYPDRNADAFILFTTGSTGKSKGCVIPHSSCSWFSVAHPRKTRQRKHARIITPFPLNHISGLYSSIYTLTNLGSFLLVDGMTNIADFFDCYDKYKPTKMSMPPMACRLLLDTGYDKLKNSGHLLDSVAFGSEPMPTSVLEKLREVFPNAEMNNTYACTETGYISCGCCTNGGDEVPLGEPFEGIEIALKDENGKITQEKGKNGQICVKSKMGLRCYYGEPELTNKCFEDGWFLMSDLGYLSEDGVLYFRGRADDIIIIGGYKVSPLETEDVALSSGMLTECACIKDADAMGNPCLRLLVVPRDKGKYSEIELRKILENKLEAYRVPRNIETVEAIQRNKNGKIDRKYYRCLKQM